MHVTCICSTILYLAIFSLP